MGRAEDGRQECAPKLGGYIFNGGQRELKTNGLADGGDCASCAGGGCW